MQKISGDNKHPSQIKIIECPRDAMQGWKDFIPTQKKVDYINGLSEVGFDTIDFGSFVSPKAIPQMADTKEVVRQLSIASSSTKLLAIVANTRGAEEAMVFDKINCLGFPLSVSPTFQFRNTNSTIEKSLISVKEIQNLCIQHEKELIVYISMAFGNPYGDKYNEELVTAIVDKVTSLGVQIISLADTVGLAEPAQISSLLATLIPQYPGREIGVHLHSTVLNWSLKIDAALKAGCKRFDGALKGVGGCPMANDELVGNMNTEKMIAHFEELGISPILNAQALERSLNMANEIFR